MGIELLGLLAIRVICELGGMEGVGERDRSHIPNLSLSFYGREVEHMQYFCVVHLNFNLYAG